MRFIGSAKIWCGWRLAFPSTSVVTGEGRYKRLGRGERLELKRRVDGGVLPYSITTVQQKT
jgi:hypothetical protein